jgi:putative ABC transport system substrate-binding protein
MSRVSGEPRMQWLRTALDGRGRQLLLASVTALLLLGLSVALTRPMFSSPGAQQPATMRRVAYLDNARSDDPPPELVEFEAELRRMRAAFGEDVIVERYFADGNTETLKTLAEQVVRDDFDVIVAFGTQASEQAKLATAQKRIPIVSSGSDPVGAGIVISLARPGEWDEAVAPERRSPRCNAPERAPLEMDETGKEWNITGLASGAKELAGKRLELLKELMPNVRRVGILWNPINAGDCGEWQETETVAELLGLEIVSLGVSAPDQIPTAFAQARLERVEALAAFASTILNSNSSTIVDCAAAARLPTIYGVPNFAQRGGLMAYGPDFVERYHRAAALVDRIFNGAKPAELSIEKAQQFKLVVNLRTAQDLGITIPRSLRAQVDEVLDGPLGMPRC